MNQIDELLTRMSRIEKRLVDWDYKRVKRLKDFLMMLYGSLHEMESFVGYQPSVQADDFGIVAPIIPEGQVLLIYYEKFEEQFTVDVPPDSYEEQFGYGALMSDNEAFIFKEQEIEEQCFPKITLQLFDGELPQSEGKTISSITVNETENDEKVVLCVPHELGRLLTNPSFNTVEDISNQGVSFQAVEANPRDHDCANKFPSVQMRKIGKQRSIKMNSSTKIHWPGIFLQRNSPISFEPGGAITLFTNILKTILWFKPLPS